MRNSSYPALTALFLALCTTACQKKKGLESCSSDCTTVAGRLLTANGQAPIGGATVLVRCINPAGLAAGAKARVKAKGRTDASGTYRISFYITDSEQTQYAQFFVEYIVDDDAYYSIENQNYASLDDAKRDTLMQLPDFTIPRLAHVCLSITNPHQLTATHGKFGSSFSSCYGVNSASTPTIGILFWDYLMSLDELPNSIKYPTPIAGDQPILVQHSRTVNGVSTVSTDSLFIPAGTTSNYTVTY
ncbi:hypothetical protein Q5H93_05700 [Hymenobacter sp. ASUV-10]|uniref:Carboxypeptidase regulatory-like domain-containing protein n=1 Tax=Hymenobacter aranciens TaxID=3063996 RepID=A0ABT9B7G4_9BACT|nr:hypothetical protein [Hymenobacter sp. ASUV-10]MDO7874219.1 hypothetical protein [Hymenobacter sp. ASUV-10]